MRFLCDTGICEGSDNIEGHVASKTNKQTQTWPRRLGRSCLSHLISFVSKRKDEVLQPHGHLLLWAEVTDLLEDHDMESGHGCSRVPSSSPRHCWTRLNLGLNVTMAPPMKGELSVLLRLPCKREGRGSQNSLWNGRMSSCVMFCGCGHDNMDLGVHLSLKDSFVL